MNIGVPDTAFNTKTTKYGTIGYLPSPRGTVPNFHVPPHILVIMGITTRSPIVRGPVRAPPHGEKYKPLYSLLQYLGSVGSLTILS